MGAPEDVHRIVSIKRSAFSACPQADDLLNAER